MSSAERAAFEGGVKKRRSGLTFRELISYDYLKTAKEYPWGRQNGRKNEL